MGELLTHSQRIRGVYIQALYVFFLFIKSETRCCAETILMRVLEKYQNIHDDFFQIEEAMAK